jgi:GNAT superfamily N-acetyltransferase
VIDPAAAPYPDDLSVFRLGYRRTRRAALASTGAPRDRASLPAVGPRIDLGAGRSVRIRALGPGDRDALAAGFEQLGPQSRYLRFFAPVARLTDAQLRYLTEIDHRDHEALVAVDEATHDGVGVARFVRIGEGVGEPAVAVTDAWQRRGVGALLLDALADRAREEGIETFVARVLADNTAVLGLLDRLDGVDLISDGDEVEVRIALREGRGAVAALHRLLRHAGEETVRLSASFWHRARDRDAF